MSEAGGRGTSAVRIRAGEPPDAAALLALKHRLDRESQFMLLEPDERTSTAGEVAGELQRLADSPNSILIVAERAGELIGYVVEGRRRECLLIDSVLVDELYMAKLLIKGDATSRPAPIEPIPAPS